MSLSQPFEYLVAAASRAPDTVALATPEVDLTYGEFVDTARRFASLLRDAGVRPGHLVAVLVPAMVQLIFVYAIFHEAAVGSIPPAGYRLSEGLAHDWIVAEKLIDGIDPSKQILLTQQTMQRLGEMDLADFRPRAYATPESTCRIAFSSGTTGRPKAIPFSVAAIDEKCTTGRERWMVDHPFMSRLGLGSVMSLLALHANVTRGETFVYPGDAGEATFAQIQNHDIACVAILVAAPFALASGAATARPAEPTITDLGSGISEIAYTYAGGYTFTAPAGVTKVSALLVGGGGGGLYESGSGAYAGGGGGVVYFDSVDVTSPVPLTVGAGGEVSSVEGGETVFGSNLPVASGGQVYFSGEPTPHEGLLVPSTLIASGGGAGGAGRAGCLGGVGLPASAASRGSALFPALLGEPEYGAGGSCAGIYQNSIAVPGKGGDVFLDGSDYAADPGADGAVILRWKNALPDTGMSVQPWMIGTGIGITVAGALMTSGRLRVRRTGRHSA